MITSAEKLAKRWFTLALSWLLLVSSGCNLGLPVAEVAAPAFDGPPRIRIASPLPDQTFLAGTTVIVQARIENAGPDLTRISVLLDGTVLGERQNPNASGAAVIPLTMDWPTSSAGQFEFAVEAVRANGELARETVNIAVIAQPVPESTPGTAEDSASLQQPTQTTSDSAAAAAPASATPFIPTPDIPRATDLPTTEASSRAGQATVKAVITVPSNLRQGPGTEYDLVGSIAVGEEVEIVGVNAARDWYHIRFGDLGDAWIYSELLNPSGDVSTLPAETGPAQPTPIPEVAAVEQTSAINLVIEEIILEPNPFICNESGSVTVVIRNLGTADSASGGWLMVQDSVPSQNLIGEPVDGYPFQIVPAGETITATAYGLIFNHHSDEKHVLTVTVNSGGHIIETTTEDNSDSEEYILQRGACP